MNPSEEETRNVYLYAMGEYIDQHIDDFKCTYTLAYSLGMILMGLGLIFMYTHSSLVAQKTGMMARIMTTAAVYQKVLVMPMGILITTVNEHVFMQVLKLDPVSISTISSGHVINIASNDVQRFDFVRGLDVVAEIKYCLTA